MLSNNKSYLCLNVISCDDIAYSSEGSSYNTLRRIPVSPNNKMQYLMSTSHGRPCPNWLRLWLDHHIIRPKKKYMLDCPFTPFFAWVGRSDLFPFFSFSRCQRTPKTALTFHERSSCQASKVLLIILYISLFLRLYFGKFLQKQFPRVISFSVFFVRSINERYHIWALLATAPSAVQWSVRLVPCESMTSDKQACDVICDTGSPYPCV